MILVMSTPVLITRNFRMQAPATCSADGCQAEAPHWQLLIQVGPLSPPSNPLMSPDSQAVPSAGGTPSATPMAPDLPAPLASGSAHTAPGLLTGRARRELDLTPGGAQVQSLPPCQMSLVLSLHPPSLPLALASRVQPAIPTTSLASQQAQRHLQT